MEQPEEMYQPEEWKCPVCGASKKNFRPLAGPGSVVAQGV